jgi:dipeptidyl aminopeptidase/acylaminoacyl peptidase
MTGKGEEGRIAMAVRAASLLALCFPLAAAAAPPPVSAFTNFPKYESMKISPDGKRLAFTRHTTEHEIITVMHYPELKLSGQAHFGDRIDIASFLWANNNRLLISPTRRFPGLMDFKAPTGEIIGINADGRADEMLFGWAAGEDQRGTRIERRQSTYSAADVVARLPETPDEVLIQTYGYGVEGEFNSVYRMNVNNGKLRRVVGSPVRNGTFLPDQDRNIAFVWGENREGSNQVFWRRPEDSEWTLLSTAAMGEGWLLPVAPSGRSGEYYGLGDEDAPTDGVFTLTPATGQKQLLYRHPVANTGLAGVDPSGKAWGFVYEDHLPRYWYPDPQHPLAQLHQSVRAAFRGHDVGITSQTDDMSLAIVTVSSPLSPRTFYVADVPTRKLLVALSSRPDLRSDQLAKVEPVEFTARDGMKIRGYLTTPRVAEEKQLPMVVVVHGGPHGVHDSYGFDWEAQLFASRGYAVLQVNYRGSSGRGREFQGAGYGRWGREMQDDVTDGVRWAIGDGVADPKRICIYGASYGAYAALTGAFREPDLFRCAIGMAGVYDLPLMFEKGDIQSVESGVNYLKKAIGTDEQELRRRSPVYNAEKIKAKVLLLHGKLDERAPYEHARRMRDALEKAGNPPEWSTEWGEGHGFFDEGNRAAAYERILEFLGTNLGVSGG